MLSIFCVLLLTLNWGLGFPKEAGRPPAGSVSSDYLLQYDAAFIGDTEKKTIYLTFDAGYENGHTGTILDTLKEKNVPAAFFIVGDYVNSAPELTRRMASEGHTVCNHTDRHPDMSLVNDQTAFQKELDALAEKYNKLTGAEMAKIYRPPSGKFSEQNLKTAKKLGYKTLFWSLAYVDWRRDNQPSPEAAMQKLTARIHPGAVVLLHSTSKTNAGILGALIDKYREMGYEFGRVEEIFT